MILMTDGSWTRAGASRVTARWLTLTLATGLGACTPRDAVKVRLTNDAPRALENLRVFAGADKSSWPTVAPGQSVGVNLRPDGEPPQLTMSFSVGRLPYSWRGPELAKGTGYALDLHIAGDGAVTERHCPLPCSLP
jgi:hypothetical protein